MGARVREESQWRRAPAPAPRATCTAADTASAAASAARRKLCRVSLPRGCCSCPFEFFFQQLFLIEVGVVAAASEEFIVWAALGDAAIAQHHDLIRVAHSRCAVRD